MSEKQTHPDRHENRIDFVRMLAEFDLTESDMRRLQEIPAEGIDFPEAVQVAVGPSPIDGTGLFALHAILAGNTIAPAYIAGKLTPAGRYINHARRPNARFDLAPTGDVSVIALCDIAVGEEITNDYRHNAHVSYASVTGCPLETITRAMVREVMRLAIEKLAAHSRNAPLSSPRCPRTGIPASVCTCVGPHGTPA